MTSPKLALDADLLRMTRRNNGKQSEVLTKSFSPYISAVFADVEEEIKHLHVDTFPKINELCLKKGVTFAPCDLRRALVDSRLFSENSLQHSLDAVKKCQPFFICILGDKYGRDSGKNSQPNGEVINPAASIDVNLKNAAKWGHEWVLDPEFEDCSFMELEIIEAALKENDCPQFCYFYARDFKKSLIHKTEIIKYTEYSNEIIQDTEYLFSAENQWAENKLTDLKMKIVKKGFNIQYFENSSDLGKKLFEDWARIINNLNPTPQGFVLDESHVQIQNLENSMARFTHTYLQLDSTKQLRHRLTQHVLSLMNKENMEYNIGSPNETNDRDFLNAAKLGDGLFSTTETFLNSLRPLSEPQPNTHKPILAIVGDPGCGKSSLVANWLIDIRKKLYDLVILSEFIGCTNTSRDIGSFFRQCKTIHSVHRKKRSTCMETLEDTESFDDLSSIFKQCLTLIPCLIVIDSLNDLKTSMGQDIGLIKKLKWLPDKIPSNCRIILTTRRSDLTYKSLLKRSDVEIIPIQELQIEEKIKVLNIHLSRHALKLSQANMDKILVNRLSEKPLYLTSLADMLNSCYENFEMDQVVDKCTELKSFREFWRTVFNLWSRRFSWNVKSNGQPGSFRSRSVASGWLGEMLRMIVSTRNGLTSKEILHLLSLLGYRGRTVVTPYDLHIFLKAARNIFSIGPTGLITFGHTEARYSAKYYLLGQPCPTATGPASISGQFNVTKHYYRLLATYFFQYGTIERKITEFPWLLEMSEDWAELCQLLCKPCLFHHCRQQSILFPQLHVDLFRYWRKLDKNGYLASNNLSVIFNHTSVPAESDTMGHHPSSVLTQSSRRLSTKLGINRRSSLSGPALKRPSLIVTQFDEATVMSTTDESRSDIEEFSETGSYSFFLTENDTDTGIRGWTANEGNHEVLLDSSSFKLDTWLELQYEVALFLASLNKSNQDTSVQILQDLVHKFEELHPLTSPQQDLMFRTLSYLARFSYHKESMNEVEAYTTRALDIFNSLSIHDVQVINMDKLYTLDIAAETYLMLSEIFIDRNLFESADTIVKLAVDIIKQTGSATVEARLSYVCAKLFTKQGMRNHANTFIQKSFTELLQWYGPTHITLAPVLAEMGHMYSVESSSQNHRLALLSYKQALEIYSKSKKIIKAADVSKRIGILLSLEETRRAKIEARECIETSLDAYLKEYGTNHDEIDVLNKLYKSLNHDIKNEVFVHSKTKLADTRSDERPYSALSWHNKDLKKLLKGRPKTAPSNLNHRSHHDRYERAHESINRSLSIQSYSAYDVKSYAKQVVMTPRPSSRAHSLPGSTSRVIKEMSEFTFPQQISEPDPSVADTFDIQSKTKEIIKEQTLDTMSGKHSIINEDDESDVLITFSQDQFGHAVVVVPAGRQSRLSMMLDVDDKSISSPRHKNPTKINLSSLNNDRWRAQSAVSSRRTHSVLSFRSLPEHKSEIHRKHCSMPLGSNGISTTVHGSFSRLKDIQDPPTSTRYIGRTSGHKSTWYNVPGRYVRPGEVVPPKRSQIRPGSAYSSIAGSQPSTIYGRGLKTRH